MSQPRHLTLAEISKAAAAQGADKALGRSGRKPTDPVQLNTYERELDKAAARDKAKPPPPPMKTPEGFKAQLAAAKKRAEDAKATAAKAEADYQQFMAEAAERREALKRQAANEKKMKAQEKLEARVQQQRDDAQADKEAAEKAARRKRLGIID